MENKENDYTEIYKYADAPIMIGNWAVDQLLIFVFTFYLANILANGFIQTIMGFAVAYGIVWVYGKYKKGLVRGAGKQAFYALGLSKPKTLAPSTVRYFIGFSASITLAIEKLPRKCPNEDVMKNRLLVKKVSCVPGETLERDGDNAASYSKCGFMLRQIDASGANKRKISIAEYASWRLHNGFFDLFICDEVHEVKGGDTGQGNAFGALISKSKKVLGLTGTLINGYAESVFYSLQNQPKVDERGSRA
jgi:hypothetical protein